MSQKPNEKLKELRRRMIYLLPRNDFIFRVCRRYVNYYNGFFDYDMHTNGELRALKAYLLKIESPVVFDVGANIGDWSSVVLQINPRAQIHCFEPGSYAFKILQDRKFPPQVVCNNFGLSSQASIGQLAVYGSEESYLNSLYGDREYGRKPKKYEEIRLSTISDYCKEHRLEMVDFMKIDVEGHEFNVLRGASDMLARQGICALQFEYNDSYVAAKVYLRDIFEFMGAFSYDAFRILPNMLLPIKKYSNDMETYEYSNYLFVLRRQS